MKQSRLSHKSDLLAEVLAEASPAEFREAMLAETLRLARQRRQRQHMRVMGGILVMAVLLIFFAGREWPKKSSDRPTANKPVRSRDYQLVQTQPLPTDAVVITGKFLPVKIISSGTAVTQIASVTGNYRLINDDELLALAAGKPVVLVRTGPHSEALFFANAEIQKKSLTN
jgi:hypothetical protein